MDELSSGMIMAMFGFVAIFLIAWLVIMIFFLIAQQNTLKAVQPQNRRMRPGEVWLQLIPLFGTVWGFIVVNRIAESVHQELNTSQFSFENGGYQEDPLLHNMKERPTRSIGLAYCICSVCTWIPMIGGVIALAAIVCWIIYWIELNKVKNQIEQRRFAEQFDTTRPVASEHNVL